MKKIVLLFILANLCLDIYSYNNLAPQYYLKNRELISLLNDVLIKFKNANRQVNIQPNNSNLRKIPIKLNDEYKDLIKNLKIESMFGNIISNGSSNILIIGHQSAGKSYLSEKILSENNKWELIVDDFVSGIVINDTLFAGPHGMGTPSVMLEKTLIKPKNQFVPITHIIYISVDDNVKGFTIEETNNKLEVINEQRKIAIEKSIFHNNKSLFQFPISWLTALQNLRIISIKRNSNTKGIKEINDIFSLLNLDTLHLNLAKQNFLLINLST